MDNNRFSGAPFYISNTIINNINQAHPGVFKHFLIDVIFSSIEGLISSQFFGHFQAKL